MIGQYPFAELQAISYSVTREKAPIYTMGSSDPRAYSRNKRGIAGSLIWINFDRHALLSLFHKALGKFVADVDEIRPQYQDSIINSSAVFASSLVRSIGPSVGLETRSHPLSGRFASFEIRYRNGITHSGQSRIDQGQEASPWLAESRGVLV